MTNADEAKSLTYDPSGLSDEELWNLVREACRKDTPTWRAYEALHSKYLTLVRMKEEVEKWEYGDFLSLE